MSPRAALAGTLHDLPLTELLPLLTASDHQGVIELDGDAPGIVAVDTGMVTLAMAVEGPTLQQVVVGSGITDTAGWEQAQREARRGIGLADALVEGGADDDRLRAALREQAVAAFFEFLLPSETSFAFLPGATHPLGGRYRFDPTELLTEAATRVDAWKVIAETIPSTAMVMRIARELPDASITVSADDWRVLSRVDGHASIADVIRSLGMSAFAVCGVLHRLVLAGCVEPTPDPS
jgi:hypothetical protein